MYIIRLERRGLTKGDPPVLMWLTTQSPMRWGERADATRFKTKGEAWRVAGTLKVNGSWSVEEV
jgi:hypothetical protein